MIKMMTQSLFIQFLLAFLECNSTCLQGQLAITYIDDQGAHALSIKIFTNQFKCTTREKFSVFVPKGAISGTHLTCLCNTGNMF